MCCGDSYKVMASFRDVDWERPFWFYGSRKLKEGDPRYVELSDLANKEEVPFDVGLVSVPLEEEVILEGEETELFLSRLVPSLWCGLFENELQCLSQNELGSLLTGSLGVEVFEEFLDELYNDEIIGELIDRLKVGVEHWKSEGAVEICFSGYELIGREWKEQDYVEA